MSAWSARQFAAVGAVVFVALAVIAFLIPGNEPNFDEDAQSMADFFNDKHDRVLVATILLGIALLVFLWVVGELCRALGDVGYRELTWATALGAAVTAAILAVCTAAFGGAAQIAATGGDVETIRSLYQTSAILQTFVGWTMLAVVIPVTVAALRGVFEWWWAWINAAIMLFLVLGGLSVQADGVFGAASGLFSVTAVLAFLGFMLEIAYMLWRPPREALPRAGQTTA